LKHNQSNAFPVKLLRLSDRKVQQIAQYPYMYRRADFPETHVAALGHFSIFYRITPIEIIVTAFWDNRQDPKKLMELLKEK
jgi:hypothetical protein